jgi:primosomal protein N' (replication factor Y)
MLNSKIDVFYEYELEKRKLLDYPPFKKMVRIVVSHTKIDSLREVVIKISDEIKKVDNLYLLGPAKAPVYKIKNKFRYNILLKSNSIKFLNIACQIASQTFNQNKKGGMQIRIDVDPYSFM